MKNENLLDQFFLTNADLVEQIVSELRIEKNDVVLEIGPGSGILTKELIKKEGRIIAVEIDRKFVSDLKKIHGKLQIIIDDALKILKERKFKFNKIVGSLPSSIVEPLMHILTQIDFERAVFVVPLKFAYKLIDHLFFSTYFDVKIIKEVSRKFFIPVPKTNWALVKIIKKPDALLTGDEERFLYQYVYEHKLAKKENALREGLIKYYKARKKPLTKNEARKIITTKNPPIRRVLNHFHQNS